MALSRLFVLQKLYSRLFLVPAPVWAPCVPVGFNQVCQKRPDLGEKWPHLGQNWPDLVPIWVRSGPIWSPFGSEVARFGLEVAPLGPDSPPPPLAAASHHWKNSQTQTPLKYATYA